MGKASCRKGRGGEREIRDILLAAGWEARVKGIWEPLDIVWLGVDCEVKRKQGGMSEAYKAFNEMGAGAFFYRADNKQWLITMTLDDYIRLHGPKIDTNVDA